MTQRYAFALLALPLVAALASCSMGDEKQYALPKELCGVTVKQRLIEGLLPAGEKLRKEKSSYGASPGLEGCTVFVDGNAVLDVEAKWRSAGHTAKEAASNPGPTMIDGGKYAVWDRGAATVVPCRAPDKKVVDQDGGDKGKAEILSIEVEVTHPEKSTEEAVKKFIGPFAQAYRKTLSCKDA